MHCWVTHNLIVIDVVFILIVCYSKIVKRNMTGTLDFSCATTNRDGSSLIEGIFGIIATISKSTDIS